MPSDLISLLNSHPDLTNTEILEGTPEHKIPLDNFRGETRNADLVLAGISGDIIVSINIEAKADEPYDQTIDKKIRSIKNPRSKIPERVDLLCLSLLGQTTDSNPGLLNLRYQLLTGCAGALIEASNIGAAIAVFLVHVFISDVIDEEKVRSNDRDFQQFLECMGIAGVEKIADCSLTGPIMLPGGPYISSERQTTDCLEGVAGLYK